MDKKYDNKAIVYFVLYSGRLFFKLPGMKKRFGTQYTNKDFIIIESQKYNLIYVENPLCGSRTMKDLFQKHYYKTFKSKTYILDKMMIDKLKNNYPDHIIFSVVRNPWNRVISFYNKKVLNAKTIGEILILRQFTGLYPKMPFQDFLKWLSSEMGNDNNVDTHLTSQKSIFYDKNNEIILTDVIKLETINDDFEIIMKKLKIFNVEVPHKGSSRKYVEKPIHDDWKEYYRNVEKGVLKLIEKRYADDERYFKYPSLFDFIK